MSLVKQFDHLKVQLESIKAATINFADDNCIGKGGFGKVYKAELAHSEGQIMVAIKLLDRTCGQGDPQFWKEILMLSKYTHENIVALLGFCDDGGEKILVYEYMCKSSLDKYLNSDDLTWVQRLKICIGAARGLAYLHDPDKSQQRVLHRDIKSSNILLDENWNARISDFGLSKSGPANQHYTFLVTHAVGTIGYCDPLYAETGLLTKKSDVYSFGVVLFEVLCGRLCIENNDMGRSLTRLVRHCYELNKMNEIIYANMKDEISPESLKVFIEIAYRCLKMDHEERPLMTDVVRELENALRCQVSGNDPITDLVQEKKMEMITGALLSISPPELQFLFELGTKMSCSMQLRNETNSHVAFKVKITNPSRYIVRPTREIVLPYATCDVIVKMQAQKEAPPNMQCEDVFLIQSAVVSPGAKLQDITSQLFREGSGNQVERHKLRVELVAQPPSGRKRVPLQWLQSPIDSGVPVKPVDSNAAPSAFLVQEKKMEMITRALLSISPPKLQFLFELRTKMSCSMQLRNETNSHVAFNVKITKASRYTVRPNREIVLPYATCDVIVTMQAQKEAPPNMQCEDVFLIQSAVVSPGAKLQDITSQLFGEGSGNQVERHKLRVELVAQPPSGQEEGSSSKASISD